MKEIFAEVLDMSIKGTYIAAAVIILRVFMRRTPRRFSYALWVIAGIRLLCPFSLPSAVSMFNLVKPEPIPDGISYSYTEYDYAGYSPETYVYVSPVPDEFPDESPETPEEPPAEKKTDIFLICSLVWAAGAAAMCVYMCVSYIRVKRRIASAVPLQDNIFVCGNISSPFVCGIIRPAIYLPADIPADETEFILAHERTHIRRGDHIVKLFSAAALCIHWFNPAVWLSCRLMTRDMELSCDETAVTGFDTDVRKDYAAALLGMSMRQNNIAGGILGFGESNIKARIKGVLAAKKPRAAVTVIAAAAVAAAAVCLLTDARSETVPNTILDGIEPVYYDVIEHHASGSNYIIRNDALLEQMCEIIRSAELTPVSANAAAKGLPDGAEVYTLCIADETDGSGNKCMISLASPIYYDGTSLPRTVRVNCGSGETAYKIPESTWSELAEIMTRYAPKFKYGDYLCGDGSKLVLSENDGIELYSPDGSLLYNGSAHEISLCGMKKSSDKYDLYSKASGVILLSEKGGNTGTGREFTPAVPYDYRNLTPYSSAPLRLEGAVSERYYLGTRGPCSNPFRKMLTGDNGYAFYKRLINCCTDENVNADFTVLDGSRTSYLFLRDTANENGFVSETFEIISPLYADSSGISLRYTRNAHEEDKPSYAPVMKSYSLNGESYGNIMEMIKEISPPFPDGIYFSHIGDITDTAWKLTVCHRDGEKCFRLECNGVAYFDGAPDGEDMNGFRVRMGSEDTGYYLEDRGSGSIYISSGLSRGVPERFLPRENG